MLTGFLALSVYPRVGISRSASKTDDRLFVRKFGCHPIRCHVTFIYKCIRITVIILNIGTDRSEQTVQTQIRLLIKEQSDQGLLCLLFCLHLLNTILHCKIQLFQL